MHPENITIEAAWLTLAVAILSILGVLTMAAVIASRGPRKKCANCDGSGIDPIEPEHGCNGCDGTGTPVNRA